jgi:hypothetical protein
MKLKSLAQSEIETAQGLGEVIRIHVIVTENQNLPKSFEPMSVIPIDILPRKPLNLSFDDNGMGIDLCFGAPPQRCTFRWEDIIAVSSRVDGREYLKPCQTTIKYLIFVDEDNWMHLVESKESAGIVNLVTDRVEKPPTNPESPRSRSHLKVVK